MIETINTIHIETILLSACCILLLAVFVSVLLLMARLKKSTKDTSAQNEQLAWRVADHISAVAEDEQRWHESEGRRLTEHMDLLSRSAAQQNEGMAAQMTSFRQEQGTNLSRVDSAVNRLSQTVAAGLASIQKGTQEQIDAMRRENNTQLTEIRKTVDEKLTESLNTRLKQSFAQVSDELEKVYKSLGEMQGLASSVGDLKKVLTNVKTRGTWGEMQLGAILESILSPGQFAANVQVVPGSGERVEYAVRLPGHDGSAVWLPLDSKFPQEDYLRVYEAAEAGDKTALDAARKALDAAIKNQAKQISKYIHAPYSTDFAVMFLPVEGLYAEVVRSPELLSHVQDKYRVVVAGPSTLAALLNSLQMGFRTLAIQQRSSEVWTLLGTIRQDFSVFSDALTQTQTRLNQASQSLDKAFSQSRRIEKDLGGVQTLGDEEL